MTFKETYILHNQFLNDNKFQAKFFVSKTITVNKNNFSSFTITPNKNLNKYIEITAEKDFIFIDFYNIDGNLKESKKYNNQGYEKIKEIINQIFK